MDKVKQGTWVLTSENSSEDRFDIEAIFLHEPSDDELSKIIGVSSLGQYYTDVLTYGSKYFDKYWRVQLIQAIV